MNFIKKVVDQKIDELVHLQFVKFSKGEFRDRAIIEAKKSGKGYTIKSSAEFGNEMVREMALKLGDNRTNITGVVVSTLDLKGDLKFKEVKQFQGVKKYVLDGEMSGNEILNLLNRLPKNFFGLSFKVNDNNQIKIKPKAPKSGKPGKGDEDAKADFCTLKTDDKKIVESYIFEKPDFSEAKIVHTIFVEDIILPKGEKDFAKIRELAKRKGRIVRKAMIDGNEKTLELKFEA